MKNESGYLPRMNQAPRRCNQKKISASGGNNSAFPRNAGQVCILPRQRRGLHSSFSSGFSLVELVVVMLVISILVVLAIEKISAIVSSTRAQSAANELRVNLRYIRNMAMDRERTTRVIFSVASNSYSVAIYGTNSFVAVNDPVTQSPWLVDVDERFPGVVLSVSNIPGNTLYFSATNGIPCYNTNSPLTTNGSINFNSGLTVTIVKDTGYIGLE